MNTIVWKTGIKLTNLKVYQMPLYTHHTFRDNSEINLLTVQFVCSSSHSLSLFVVVALLDFSQPLWSSLALWLVVFPWVLSLTSLVVSSHCSLVVSCAACLILYQPLLQHSGFLLFFVPLLDSWLVSRVSYFFFLNMFHISLVVQMDYTRRISLAFASFLFVGE